MSPLRTQLSPQQRGTHENYRTKTILQCAGNMSRPPAPQSPASETVVAFLIGLGSMLFVRIGGYLALTELYFLLRLIRHFPTLNGRPWSSAPAGFICVWLIWLAGTLLSDIVNETPIEFAAKGFARALFAGVTTLGVYGLLQRNLGILRNLLWGLSISMVASLFILSPGQLADGTRGEELRFTFSHSINYIVLAFVSALVCSSYKRHARLAIAGLFLSGAGFIFLGSRSAGACQAAAAISLVAMRASGLAKTVTMGRLAFSTKALGGAVVLVAVVTVFYGYRYMADQALLSHDALSKHVRATAKSNELAGSRGVYFMAGFFAWLDRPLLGHGSSPRDTNAYLVQACGFLGLDSGAYVEGYNRTSDEFPILPVHSMLMSSGVEQGIFGLCFSVYILRLYSRFTLDVVRFFPPYSGYAVLAFWLGVWSLLFSPPPHRMLGAIPLALLLVAVYHGRNASAQNLERSPKAEFLRRGKEKRPDIQY